MMIVLFYIISKMVLVSYFKKIIVGLKNLHTFRINKLIISKFRIFNFIYNNFNNLNIICQRMNAPFFNFSELKVIELDIQYFTLSFKKSSFIVWSKTRPFAAIY